jgi:hypothetical protein
VGLKTADVIHKVKVTIQQAQNNRFSMKLLRGVTVNKIFHLKEKVPEQEVEILLSKNPSDLFQVKVPYFYKPAKKYF